MANREKKQDAITYRDAVKTSNSTDIPITIAIRKQYDTEAGIRMMGGPRTVA